MEQLNEFVDSLVKSQKEFMENCTQSIKKMQEFFANMENWVKPQKEFMENWTESIKKMQDFFTNMGGSQDGTTKEILGFYNSLLTTMVNSSNAFSKEAEKIQETWKNTIENQMEMGKGMAKNFSESFKQGDEKK